MRLSADAGGFYADVSQAADFINYKTLLPFLDMAVEMNRMIKGEHPFEYMILTEDIVEEPNPTENGLPIINMEV